MSAILHLHNIGITLGDKFRLRDVSVELQPGEQLALVGPSGSGKSTLLRLVCGLLTPQSGRVAWGDETWSDAATRAWIEPERRGIGMLFQDPALWPHLNVLQHLTLAARWRGVPAPQREPQARAMLERVGLADKVAQKPATLSGGEAQRLALARAFMGDTRLLLLDEPFGRLDLPLQRSLSRDVQQLARQRGSTVILVTHNPAESFGLADRILALEDGAPAQLATPTEMQHAPASDFLQEVVRIGREPLIGRPED